jgi:putative membrane protein
MVGLAGGIGASALLEGLVPGWMVMAQAMVPMLFAVFCFVAGVWRQLFKVEPDAPDIARLPGWMLIGTNVFLALVAATVLLGLWTGGHDAASPASGRTKLRPLGTSCANHKG